MDRIKRYIYSSKQSNEASEANEANEESDSNESDESNASSSEFYDSDDFECKEEDNLEPELNDEISKYKFHSNWSIWYHHQKNNWKLDSYKQIFIMDNIRDFWNFNNNLNIIGGINTQHYFMMRNDITPIWEDDNNKNGGCWSIKIPVEKSYELWIKLSMYIVGESLTNDELLVNGISICAKNTTTSVVKIWINDNKKCSISSFFLNKSI